MPQARRSTWVMTLFFLFFAAQAGASDTAIQIRMAPENSFIAVNSQAVEPVSESDYVKTIRLNPGNHTISLWRPGYEEREQSVSITGRPQIVELKLEKTAAALSLQAIVSTGIQPKSVEFTPDGGHFLVTLLEGPGIELFSAATREKIKTISMPEAFAKLRGFVEIAYIPLLKEVWVSQMTADRIHVLDLETFAYKTSFYSGGNWSKVITVSHDESIACVSNWLSKTISFFRTLDKKLLATVKVPGTPRGMSFTPDDKFLYVCNYDNGNVDKISVADYRLASSIRTQPGAKRHAVLDENTGYLFLSDMARGSVSILDTATDTIITERYIDEKLNTIKLSPDGKYLFVSSRGPNNPADYTLKGPRFGKVYVLDAGTLTTLEWVWGMNQPTGLDISPDGGLLVFTDFLDRQVEVYRFDPRLLPPPVPGPVPADPPR